jgi:hypothetical protein
MKGDYVCKTRTVYERRFSLSLLTMIFSTIRELFSNNCILGQGRRYFYS